MLICGGESKSIRLKISCLISYNIMKKHLEYKIKKCGFFFRYPFLSDKTNINKLKLQNLHFSFTFAI